MDSIKTILENLKKDPKRMMIVISVVVALALLIDLNFLLKPQIVNMSGTRGKLGKLSADLKSAKSDIARIDSMKKEVETYNKKVGQYEKPLPTEEGIPDLLGNLSEMAKSANMRIAGIVPAEHKEAKSANRAYKEIPIMIPANAGYNELGQFLSSLENSDRFMKVSDIQIRADKMMPKRHDVELLVVTYVLLEGK